MRAVPLGKAASVLVCVVAFMQVLIAFTDWQNYLRYRDDPQSWETELNVPLVAVLAVAFVGAIITFIAWLRQVRANAERLCMAPHRHDRGWVIGGWFVPVVWFWYPKQIVDDIVVASSPRTPPRVASLPMEQSGVVQVWWATWLAFNLLDTAAPSVPDRPDSGDLVLEVSFSIVSAVLVVVCAVYAVRVIRLVNGLQASRPWVAWWETEESRSVSG